MSLPFIPFISPICAPHIEEDKSFTKTWPFFNFLGEIISKILNNYDKTEGELLSFEHTLTIECIPSEEVYEYIIGKKIFEYSEGDSSFTFDDYW